MQKLILFIAVSLGLAGSVNEEHLDFRPEISTGITKVVMDVQVPDNKPDEDTLCDGSGYITHGDGHKTECPGCKACDDNGDVPPSPPEDIEDCDMGSCSPVVKSNSSSSSRRRGLLKRIFRR